MLQLDSRWGDRRDLDAANHPCFGETNITQAKKGQIQIAVLALAASAKVGVQARAGRRPLQPPRAQRRPRWRAELEGKTRSDFADIVQIGGKDPSDGQVAQALGGCEYRASMRSAACLLVPPSFFF